MPAHRRLSRRSLMIAAGVALPGVGLGQEDGFASARRALARDIDEVTRLTAQLTGVARIAPEILAAFAEVPRHLFVPEPLARFAYADRPLPLGHGQNLTQPSLLALMAELALPLRGQRVFETGTDTGYFAAILARLGAEVWSMEVVEPLLRIARELFRRHALGRVELALGDGWYGWAERAPFDAILCKESATHVPPPLLVQLAPGGRLVIPLGPAEGEQRLTLVTRRADGSIVERAVMPVRFAPFQGGDRI